MPSLTDILDRLFTASAPCALCGRAVPIYTDPETRKGYCLPCPEAAVEEAQAEIQAERQDMALLACWGRQIADAPAETPAAFVPDTAERVDWVLKKIAAARAEALLIRTNMEKMARAAERDAEHLTWKYGAAIQTYLQTELAGSKGDLKSKRLPHGVIGYRTKPASACVTDPAALAWAKDNLPEAVTVALDKKALSARLVETGEAFPFAAFQPAEEVFYIK